MNVGRIARLVGVLGLVVGPATLASCSGDSDSSTSTSTATAPPSTSAGASPTAVEGEPTATSTSVIVLSTVEVVKIEGDLMPDVLCMDLQDAQNLIQDNGVFFSRSQDASGKGRRQIVDRNWIVVAQEPAAGTPIGEGDAMLSVLKDDEVTDCG